ncbi:MAG: hypothetical protein AB7E26_06680 [Chryseobacterium sp.]
MKKYTIQNGDSLHSLAEELRVKNGQLLRSYHNMYCPLDDLLGYELVPGKELLVPEESEYLRKNDKINEPVNDIMKPEKVLKKNRKSHQKRDRKKRKAKVIPVNMTESTSLYKKECANVIKVLNFQNLKLPLIKNITGMIMMETQIILP